MRHPRTPDHTIDIPNRRWLGLVKSWRIALHKYDPEELQSEFAAQIKTESEQMTTSTDNDTRKQPTAKPLTVQEKQIAEAATKGLLVDFNHNHNSSGAVVVKNEASVTGIKTEGMEESVVVGGEDYFPAGEVVAENVMDELDKLEAGVCDEDEEDFLDYDDSDDDLL